MEKKIYVEGCDLLGELSTWKDEGWLEEEDILSNFMNASGTYRKEGVEVHWDSDAYRFLTYVDGKGEVSFWDVVPEEIHPAMDNILNTSKFNMDDISKFLAERGLFREGVKFELLD